MVKRYILSNKTELKLDLQICDHHYFKIEPKFNLHLKFFFNMKSRPILTSGVGVGGITFFSNTNGHGRSATHPKCNNSASHTQAAPLVKNTRNENISALVSAAVRFFQLWEVYFILYVPVLFFGVLFSKSESR